MGKIETLDRHSVLRRIVRAFFRFRWLLALVLLTFCVFFEIHGSSISIYSDMLGTPDINLIGKSRPIRSDEWRVNTPLAFSQYYNNFHKYSDIPRGTLTDMGTIYGQPVKDWTLIFKPFYIGYLFMSQGRGLSFFWMGRWIALFLISFEFGLLVCRRKKLWALCYAFSIAFAPLVQWWFAVNFIAELLIFGQTGVLLVNAYLKSGNYLHRLFYTLCLSWVSCSYAWSLYPAWQVPLAYVFGACALSTLIENRNNALFSKKDIALAVLYIFLTAGLLGMLLYDSRDTVKIVRNTVYPGSRFITGIGATPAKFIKYTFSYLWGIILPFTDFTQTTNNCEAARFFDLAPLGIILMFENWIKKKKADSLSVSMAVVLLFSGCWFLFKWPAPLARFTLMSNVTERIVIGSGLVNLILLYRALSDSDSGINESVSLVLSALFSGILPYIAYKAYPFDLHIVSHVLIMSAVSLLLWFFALRKKDIAFAVTFCLVLLVCGCTVNPVAHGTDSIYKSPVINEIHKIASSDSGLWIVNDNLIYNNLPIIAGARTINSINTYPALERWRGIDPEEKYSDIYNRYAHIIVKIATDSRNDAAQKKFQLNFPDSFTVILTASDLRTLQVRYILSSSIIPSFIDASVHCEEIYCYNTFRIYKLDYL